MTSVLLKDGTLMNIRKKADVVEIVRQYCGDDLADVLDANYAVTKLDIKEAKDRLRDALDEIEDLVMESITELETISTDEDL